MTEKKGRQQTFCLVSEGKDVSIVAGFESANVIVLCTLEDLCERGEVDTEGYGAVTAETLEAGRLELDGDEGDVRVVHSLELLTRPNGSVASRLGEELRGGIKKENSRFLLHCSRNWHL